MVTMQGTLEPLVINVALTGMVPTRADNPHVPISPKEIVEDAVRCHAAGARVFHVHARDAREEPIPDKDVFSEIIRGIRSALPGAIVCATTSGRIYTAFEQRSAVLDLEGDAKPDLASLTLGSMNFPRKAVANDPEMIQRLARRMQERGIVPELELFDLGMLDYAHYLIQREILRPPYVFNLMLGSLGTLAATAQNLGLMLERLPQGAFWAAAGVGRFQRMMNALGVVLGGHVRTGIEDNLYLDYVSREPAANTQLVDRAAAVAKAMGRPMASFADTRRLLGLPS